MAKLSGKKLILILLLLGLSYLLNSQTTEPKFDTFPASIVQAFYQDAQGFMWIGTQEGLLRYDGYTFKHYSHTPFDSTSISNNWVSDIKEDKHGNLWIATFGGGLNYFDQKTERFRRFSGYSDQDKINFISKIVVNSDESIWFTSTIHSLTHLKPGKSGQPEYTTYRFFEESAAKQAKTKNSALTLHKDKDGIIWVGMATEGLVRFDPATGNMKQLKNEPNNLNSISHNTVSAICEDDKGNLWIGTGHPKVSQWGAGLNMYDRKKDIFRHFKVDFSGGNCICSNEISSLLIDHNGFLWIGSPNNFINKVSLKEIQTSEKPYFHHINNLYKPHITTLYEDQQGTIWIGQIAMYSQKFNPRQSSFSIFTRNEKYPNSLTSSGTWIVYADLSGRIWFANAGLDVYDPVSGNFQHYYSNENDPVGLSENMIIGIRESADGQIWLATWHKGIDILNPVDGTFKHLRADPSDSSGLHSNIIQQILPRSDKEIWIASGGGVIQLYEYNSGIFHTYNLGPESNNNFHITNLYQDRTGILWIGTYSSGLYALRLDNELKSQVVHYKNDPHNPLSLGCNAITDIIQPSLVDTGSLWITTSAGLNRMDLKDGTFRHFYREDGLSTNFVLKILEDDLGNLWCSTTNGLSVYHVKTGEIRTFSESDGLPVTNFGASRQCASKDREGRLYFAGGNGVLSFQPRHIIENTTAPPVRLTDFRIFQQSVVLDTAIQFRKTITLSHDQNMFSFQFAALNFTNPGKNQYAYKMQGFLDEWIDIGHERITSFTNLDPGSYVFRVKGSNNHGVWNEEGASINIIILPPWWKTNWAYFSYLFIFIFAIFALRRYDLKRQRLKHDLEIEHVHTEKLKEVDKLKSRFFANISHEFRTPLTLLLGPISRLLGKISDREDVKDLQVMQKNAKRLQKLISELLDLSKIEEGKVKLQVQQTDIVSFMNRIVQTFESQADIKNIELKFKSELTAQSVFFDTAKMENVFYNLLSNAFKFTPDGGVVEVSLKHPPISPLSKGGLRGVQITVTNSGSFIPPEKINQIFDRFYQVDDSFTREHEGSGIGLALTNELIKLHHGTIEVESNSESGTIFTVTLPLGKQHFAVDEIFEELVDTENKTETEIDIVQSPIDIDEVNDKNQSTKLLIVEDNADMREYIKSCFKSDYFIIEAQDGISGFDISVNELPDLIISDVMMPKMDGFQLCEKIKSDQRTSHIPLILLTARAEMQDKLNGLDTGADDYVVKPFEVKELQARVRNLIQQRKKLQQQFMKNELYLTNELALTSQDEKFLNRAIEIIENNLSDSGFDVDSFVKNIGISRAHLYHKFKTITGQSVKDFIRTIRLKRSLQMIKNNTGNISEIAYEVGFSNPAYFSKCFREQFGFSPSQYSHRQKH